MYCMQAKFDGNVGEGNLVVYTHKNLMVIKNLRVNINVLIFKCLFLINLLIAHGSEGQATYNSIARIEETGTTF